MPHALAALVLAALLLPGPAADGPAARAGDAGPGVVSHDGTAARTDAATVPDTAAVVPPVDHHVHVRSVEGTRAFRDMQKAVGQEVVADDRLTPTGAEEVLAALDSAGVEHGVLLSVAYMFGAPELERENERELVAAENDFVARQAAARPDRLTAFFSVNPLADYALEEMERCAGNPHLTGLKLHLANSDVDLRDPADVDRLRQVFARAQELGTPVVIHMGTRAEDYGTEDARAFVDEVLPAAPDVTVQVAHLAGSGGFDEGTDRALQVFLDAMERRPELVDDVIFDLSAVPQPPAMAEGRPKVMKKVRAVNERVRRRIRDLGPDRVVYGTDWDAISVDTYVRSLPEALDMDEDELRDLLDDRAPYLR